MEVLIPVEAQFDQTVQADLAIFRSQDADFLALTKDADGRLPLVMSPKAAEQMKMNP